jgi:hypothetical protein
MLNPWKEIDRLRRENEVLRIENQQLKELVKTLLARITTLKTRLAQYENPKNSRNSSIPPSHDYTRPPRTRSLREPSDKKPGGQPVHEGTTLAMTDKPDRIIQHVPQFCTCCGSGILSTPTAIAVNIAIMRAFVQMRQVLEAHKELAKKIDDIEKRFISHDEKIKLIFQVIRQLIEKKEEPPVPRNRSGIDNETCGRRMIPIP